MAITEKTGRLGRAGCLLGPATLACAGLATVALVIALASGLRPAVVESGSMRPLLDRGTLVLVRPTAPAALHRGDVITFAHPLRTDGTLVTHRIVEVRWDKGQPLFVTRGDANASNDPWLLDIEQEAGRLELEIPFAGRAALFVRSGEGFAILLLFPAALLAMLALARIWRSAAEPSRA